MGHGASAAGSKYRRGPPQPQQAGSSSSSAAASSREKRLRAKLRAARQVAEQALEREAQGVLRSWARVEQELRQILEKHSDKSAKSAEEVQLKSMLRAAVMVHDSTQLGVCVRRGARLGLGVARLAQVLETLMEQEEAEGLWCCLSTALMAVDCLALDCWLEEARAKGLQVPSEVREFWLEVAQPAEQDAKRSRHSGGGFGDWAYQDLFEARVSQAHARGDRPELRRLVAEARRFGVDPGAAQAALIALKADRDEAVPARRSVRRSGRSSEDEEDLELRAARGWGAKTLESELEKLGGDFRSAKSRGEMLRLLRRLGADRGSPRDSAGAAAAADGRASPRTRLERALNSTRAQEQRPPVVESVGAQRRSCAKDQEYPSAWSGAARESTQPAPAQEYPGAWSGAARERVHPSAAGQEYPGAWGGAARERVRPPAGEASSPDGGGCKPEASGSEDEEARPAKLRTELSRAEALEVLGLPPEASQEDIRRAYRRCALRWHPDRQHNHKRPEEATQAFQKACAAFELLRE